MAQIEHAELSFPETKDIDKQITKIFQELSDLWTFKIWTLIKEQCDNKVLEENSEDVTQQIFQADQAAGNIVHRELVDISNFSTEELQLDILQRKELIGNKGEFDNKVLEENSEDVIQWTFQNDQAAGNVVQRELVDILNFSIEELQLDIQKNSLLAFTNLQGGNYDYRFLQWEQIKGLKGENFFLYQPQDKVENWLGRPEGSKQLWQIKDWKKHKKKITDFYYGRLQRL